MINGTNKDSDFWKYASIFWKFFAKWHYLRNSIGWGKHFATNRIGTTYLYR